MRYILNGHMISDFRKDWEPLSTRAPLALLALVQNARIFACRAKQAEVGKIKNWKLALILVN